MSNEYFAAPVVLSGASMREMLLPMSLRWSAVGQSTLTILRAPFLGRISDREQHARIRSTATKVASQPSPHFVDAGIRMLAHERRRGGHKARSAKSALLRVMFHERLLYRSEFVR